MRADALPNLHSIPIRGDVVLTRRLEGGWEHPQAFCKLAKISQDRLASIERGGEKVYKKTLIRLARTLSADWQALVDWAAIDRGGSGQPDSRQRPKAGKHKILIGEADPSSDRPLDVSELVKMFGEIASSKGKIVSVAVSDGKLTVGLEITDAAAIQFAESYFDAPVEKGKLISATLLLDYRVAGRVIAGGGLQSKLARWIELRYDHFTKVIKLKLGILKVAESDLPLNTEYYYWAYSSFEQRLQQAIRNGICRRTADWFHYSGTTELSYLFSPDGVGRCEIHGKTRTVDWLYVGQRH